MLLHATLKLENVSDFTDEVKKITYHSLVTTAQIWSNKLNRETEQVISISIPQKFNWMSAEFKKYIGKEITVQVRERIYDGKFNGYALDSDQFQVSDSSN